VNSQFSPRPSRLSPEYGKIAPEIRRQDQLTPFISPFTFARSDLRNIDPNSARLLTAIIETAGETMRRPPMMVSYGYLTPFDGHRRKFANSAEFGRPDFRLQTNRAWAKITQSIAVQRGAFRDLDTQSAFCTRTRISSSQVKRRTPTNGYQSTSES
jgi:hypothetical protein